MNTSGDDAVARMMAFTDDEGYDDMIVFAPFRFNSTSSIYVAL